MWRESLPAGARSCGCWCARRAAPTILKASAAETVIGDLREPESLRSAVSGCDAVMHVAADYRLWVRDPQAMYAANVDGTRNLLQIAREAGCLPLRLYVERGDDGLSQRRNDRR